MYKIYKEILPLIHILYIYVIFNYILKLKK